MRGTCQIGIPESNTTWAEGDEQRSWVVSHGLPDDRLRRHAGLRDRASNWEPEDGRFDLDWLQPTLDAAHDARIGVILGTPIYAVSMWLARSRPEIAAGGEVRLGPLDVRVLRSKH